MKILHFYRDFAVCGGVPGQVRAIAIAQAQLGHEVIGICRGIDLNCDLKGIYIHEIQPGFLSIFSVLNKIKETNANIIHFSSPLIVRDVIFCFLAILLKNKVVISPHGVLSPLGVLVRFGGKKKSRIKILAKKIFIALFVKPLLRRVYSVHAESKYEYALIKEMGVKNVNIVPMGIDSDWLCQPNKKNHEVKVFSYLGRLDVYHKGLDIILDAASLLKKEGLRFKVRFVGSDVSGSINWLNTRISELRLKDTVVVEPPAWDVEKDHFFCDTDFFLGVFRYAGMARACGEAIARGIPLIASREGCWGDWVEEGGFGFAIDLSAKAVFSAMRNAIEMSEVEYSMLSSRTFGYAERLSWREIGNKTVMAYSFL